MYKECHYDVQIDWKMFSCCHHPHNMLTPMFIHYFSMFPNSLFSCCEPVDIPIHYLIASSLSLQCLNPNTSTFHVKLTLSSSLEDLILKIKGTSVSPGEIIMWCDKVVNCFWTHFCEEELIC